MIGYLKGTVAASDGQIVTLMVGGVGFEVMMPNDGETLFTIGEEAPSTLTCTCAKMRSVCTVFPAHLRKSFSMCSSASPASGRKAPCKCSAFLHHRASSQPSPPATKIASSLPGIGKKPLRVSSLNSAKRSPKNFRSSLRMRQPCAEESCATAKCH